MKTLLILIIGAAIGIGAYIYFKEPQNRSDLEHARNEVSESAGAAKEKIESKVQDIDTEDIKSELKQTGKVIRTNAQQAKVAIKDVAADARITTEIKGRYALDPELSALKISVNTTDGIVTLAGSAASPEDIKKAMQIALQTDGVSEVVSTLQVKP
jgi:osmotically-inducible protein OsmY